MAEKGSAGQTDKAAVEAKTAQVGQDTAAEQSSASAGTGTTATTDTATTGADANNPEGSVPDEALAGNDPQNPYPNYDFMTLEQLQSLADERGVEMNRDVLKAHLVTELRAADSGTVSPSVRRGAR